MEREQIIKEYCKAAEFYFLSPWELEKSKELFEEYNITKDDFVKIISEDVYGAMFIGCEDWKPRFEFTEEEYKNINNRESFKLEIWHNLSKLPQEFRDKLSEAIRINKISEWEELDCAISSCILFKDINDYINKKGR